MIKGGYYIKSRIIQESEIAHAPPHVREIWDYLLREANHNEGKVHGKVIKRGQTIRSYRDIQDGLHWMVGFRKETYTKWQCEIAMKWLMKRTMVTTTKTTRGLIITINNYDYYQEPKNYENHKESHNKTTTEPQGTDTINKKKKNVKNKNEEILNFYKEELEKTDDKNYHMLVDFFYGNNDTGEPLKSILDIPKQLTYNQFQKLYNKSKQKNKRLSDKIYNLENHRNVNTYRSLYLTLNEWLNRD